MSLQTDSDSWTVTNPGVSLNSVTFNGTFDTAPVNTIIFGVINKSKTMIDDGTITTTGCDIGGETGPARYFAKEPGYDAGAANTHPEMDSDTHLVSTTKVLEAISFNSTFSNVPEVITGYMGSDAGNDGGKTSSANITTTGCDVAGEIKAVGDKVNWWAIYTNGFWEV
jgi:hypothetical protein